MSNTTADKLALLAANKTNIKTAINLLNPSTAPTDVLSQWSEAIKSTKTLVKFCRFTGKQYFFLSTKGNNNIGIRMKCRIYTPPTAQMGFFGVNPYLMMYVPANAASSTYVTGNYNMCGSINGRICLPLGVFGIFDCSRKSTSITINGVKYSSSEYNKTFTDTDTKIPVGGFCSSGGNTIYSPLTADVASIETYDVDTSEVIESLAPDTKNGVDGFYDESTETFYSSVTSTPLTKMEEYV